MKTRFLLIISIVALSIGISVLVLGAVSFVEVSKAIEEYSSSPLYRPGSSVPYPTYDQAEFYFGVSGIFFAAGGSLLVIWKRGK